MAAGRGVIFDKPEVLIGTSPDSGAPNTPTTDISAYLSQVMFGGPTYVTTETPHTFGQPARNVEISDSYAWDCTITFVTDDYGASTIDQIMRDLMQSPMGTGTGRAEIRVSPLGSTNKGTATSAARANASPPSNRAIV